MEQAVIFILCITACIALGIIALGLSTLFFSGVCIAIRIVKRISKGHNFREAIEDEL